MKPVAFHLAPNAVIHPPFSMHSPTWRPILTLRPRTVALDSPVPASPRGDRSTHAYHLRRGKSHGSPHLGTMSRTPEKTERVLWMKFYVMSKDGRARPLAIDHDRSERIHFPLSAF
jgi:hypothetical protein